MDSWRDYLITLVYDEEEILMLKGKFGKGELKSRIGFVLLVIFAAGISTPLEEQVTKLAEMSGIPSLIFYTIGFLAVIYYFDF